jgi:hypothetical protein
MSELQSLFEQSTVVLSQLGGTLIFQPSPVKTTDDALALCPWATSPGSARGDEAVTARARAVLRTHVCKVGWPEPVPSA